MDKWEYQNKPCYLENHVVREPCKQRTACIFISNSKEVQNKFETSSEEHEAKDSDGKTYITLLLAIARKLENKNQVWNGKKNPVGFELNFYSSLNKCPNGYSKNQVQKIFLDMKSYSSLWNSYFDKEYLSNASRYLSTSYLGCCCLFEHN